VSRHTRQHGITPRRQQNRGRQFRGHNPTEQGQCCRDECSSCQALCCASETPQEATQQQWKRGCGLLFSCISVCHLTTEKCVLPTKACKTPPAQRCDYGQLVRQIVQEVKWTTRHFREVGNRPLWRGELPASPPLIKSEFFWQNPRPIS
jgi:hypothetical protein